MGNRPTNITELVVLAIVIVALIVDRIMVGYAIRKMKEITDATWRFDKQTGGA